MSLSPSPTKSHAFDYEAGMKLMRARNFEDALSEFRGVVRKDPDHALANFQVGRILLEAFQASDAIIWLAKAATLEPSTAPIWQGWAEAVALGGSGDDRNTLLASLKTAPIKPDLRLQLQDRFGSRRKSSRPNLGGLSKELLNSLISDMNAGEFQKVESKATKLSAAHPKSAVAAFFQAEAQARQGKTQPAFSNYQKAIKIDPLYAEAYGALGQMLALNDQPQKAIKAFRPAVMLTPDSIPAIIGLVRGLRATGMNRPAIVLIGRAVKLDPKNPIFHTGLADVWKQLGEHENAVRNYEKAVALYEGQDVPSTLRLALADSRSMIQQDTLALSELEEVLREDPNSADGLISKASILQTMGDFEAGEAVFRQAIELEPENGEAYRRMLIGQKTKPGDPVIDAMIEQFQKPELGENDRMNLGYALGKALEDVRVDDQVFKYLNEGNRIAAKLSEISAKQMFGEIASSRDAYSAIDFELVPEITENTFAPIFVTGLPRSGTTLIEQIIAAHSTVESGGELGYAKPLCRDLWVSQPGSPQAADSVEALADVGRGYTEAVNGRFPNIARITDKSIYTFLAIGPLKRALPNAKFIVVRRDPRDNLLSIYKNKFGEGTHGYANNLQTLARYYDEFDRTIAFWREHLPSDWFYEVSYDALVSDPEPEARKLIAACGLEWEDDCLNFHQKADKVRTLSLYQVRQPISKASLSGWRRFESDLAPMLDQLRKDGHVTD